MRTSSSPRRPSAAMIVATLALIFAMVGTAVAGTDGISSKLTKSKVKSIAKKVADKELKANVAGSHVNTADDATNATNAQTAQNGLDTSGFATNDGGTITDSTMAGVTVSKVSNTYTYTFPSSVVDCVPVVSGQFESDFAVIQLGTGNPTKIQVSAFGVTGDHQLIVTCP